MIRVLQGLRGWRRAGFAVVLGALGALALPPIGLWPVLFVVVPLFLLLLEEEERTMAAAVLGWAFGFGYFVVAFHWIGFAFLVDAETYLWMMPFMVGGLAAAMAAYWAVAAAFVTFLQLNRLALAVGFAVAVAIVENLRGRLFTGFPWSVPGLAVDGMGAMDQGVSLVGMTGYTLLLILWAGLPLALIRRERLAPAIALALTLPGFYAYGAWRLTQAETVVVPGVSLRIVQPNISQDDKWRSDNARPIFDKYLSMSAAASAGHPEGIATITHVIWPESAVPFLIDQSDVAMRELARLLAGKTTLVTGAIRKDATLTGPDGEAAVHNSIIAFNGKAEVVARYDKWRLVPGGEFLPFEWLLEPLGFRRVVTVPGSFVAGPGPVSVAVPGAPLAGMLVCYEAIFPHALIDGGQRPAWLLNVTNDGWFGKSTGPHQHFAQARLRAIEQGLPLVRAANTGISAVVDGYGRTIHALPLGVEGVLDSELPGQLVPTLYARFGDAILAVLLLLGCIVVGLARLQKVPARPASLKVQAGRTSVS
jgi:apolipoprotein N-acyltransferase